ncbi:hypothetical protein BH11ARM2_BH11ARM2_21750 [soil metagenome]
MAYTKEMRAVATKDSRIDLRVNVGQKALFEQAAQAQGKKLTDFVISASTEAAEIALADQNRFLLPTEQMDRFLASLEEEPRIIPELAELLRRKSVFER